MNIKMLKGLLSSSVLLAIGAMVTSSWFHPRQSPPPPPAPVEPLDDLVKSTVPGNLAKAVHLDLVRSWYDWATVLKTVSVIRRERQSTTSPWYEQIQDLSTSYYPVDVRSLCSSDGQISEMYVAGVYPNGDACIERWVVTYPPANSLTYVPISDRRMPTVRRAELYRGQQYGHIRSIEPDPDGRFVLFLTLETPTLYRLPLPSGSISVELSQSSVPYLSNVKQVLVRQHATEGRQYHLLTSTRWEANLAGPNNFIVLHDADNDGRFDAPVVLTPQNWTDLGYDSATAWVTICPN